MNAGSSEEGPRWRIGTMGFGYADWRGVFYPESLKPGDYLGFYARHFDAVEIDSSFYADPGAARFSRWAASVPHDFRFCVKTPRAITHESIITDGIGPMKTFVESAKHLDEKLGCILIQYPPALPGRVWPQVERFLDALPGGVRYAVEFREPSWFREPVYRGLRERGITLVNAEYGEPPTTPQLTSDLGYLRVIGIHETYDLKTHERVDKSPQLKWWHEQIRHAPIKTVFCMFNNDYAGFSIATADRMRRLVGQRVSSREERLGVLF